MGKTLKYISFGASLFALCVIALGAFTRLMDAGLGCPDWPGCYGHVAPMLQQANNFKAWAEMIHRYAVSILSILILTVIILIWSRENLRSRSNVIFSVLLILLLAYQILLGQWTVTLKLLPVIVSQHLLGGFFILSILWLIFLNTSPVKKVAYDNLIMVFAVIGLCLLVVQIMLGAWTSTNYAALSCPDFPFCVNDRGVTFHFKEAFNLFAPVGVNYQGGVLPEMIRQTIQMMHRLGALVVTSYLFVFSIVVAQKLKHAPTILKIIYVLLGLLLVQITLGIMNVLFRLAVHSAVAHTVCAALLLLTMLTLIVKLRGVSQHA